MSGNAPAEWPKARLGDHATVKARLGWKGLKAEEYVYDGPVFLAAPNLRGGRIDFDNVDHLPQWRYDESPEIQLAPSDVLLVKDGSTLGMSGIVKELPAPTTVNGSIAVIRPRSSLSSGFLYHSINGRDFQRLVWIKRSGLGVPHLFQADLREFEICLPSRLEQERIAEFLSTLDEVIEHSEALVAKYQRIKIGLLHDLFTRGVTADGQLRPRPSEAPQLFTNSPLGSIPAGWTCCAIETLLSNTFSPMRSGPFGSSLLKGELVESGIPLLGIDNILPERFVPTFTRYVSARKFAQLRRYAVRPGDVVITIMGTVGRCCVVPSYLQDALSSKHLWTMTFDVQKVLPELICWQMNYAPWVKRWFSRCSQGAVMDAIQSSTLKNLILPIPPLAEQRQILARYLELTGAIQRQQERAAKLRHLKSGLMHDLLTGHVRVKLAEAATT